LKGQQDVALGLVANPFFSVFHEHASFPTACTVVPARCRSTIKPGVLRCQVSYTDAADHAVTDIT
jgi:hypothetical protein